MQNLFVSENDEFVINFVVAIDKKGTIFCDINEDSLKETMAGLSNFDNCEIKKYEAVFKKPSFGDTMSLYESIFSVNNQSSVNFNPVLARYRKIALLIKKWDLTPDGSSIKPTEDQIRSLHPVIANAIGIQVDAETGGTLIA